MNDQRDQTLKTIKELAIQVETLEILGDPPGNYLRIGHRFGDIVEMSLRSDNFTNRVGLNGDQAQQIVDHLTLVFSLDRR